MSDLCYLHSTLIKYKDSIDITIICCVIYLHSTLIKYKELLRLNIKCSIAPDSLKSESIIYIPLWLNIKYIGGLKDAITGTIYIPLWLNIKLKLML